MTRPALASMSGAHLRHNVDVVRRAAPGRCIYGVVKADAYGHGLSEVTDRLIAAGVDGLAVASLEEAQTIRAVSTAIPVLLLEGVVDATEAPIAAALRLDQVIHCEAQAQGLIDNPVSDARVWVKHDSGMHRLGMDAPTCQRVWRRLKAALPNASLGLMTHFASADELENNFMMGQQQAFAVLTGALGAPASSSCNSAAVLRGFGTETDWVRPGLMLYGLSPFGSAKTARPDLAAALKPVMQLTSNVISVLTVSAGETVGYAHTWRAERDSRIAVIAFGYGDGYPRHAPNGTPVMVNGALAPLVGRVSMDMLSVDVTELASVERGDPVELWGLNLPADRVAECCNTIAYELVCKVTPRVRRRWTD